jgi:DNA-binding CsgD family transcriptional regulator
LNESKKLFGDEIDPDELREIQESIAEMALWDYRPEDARLATLDGLEGLTNMPEHIFGGRLLLQALRAHADLAIVARDRRSARSEQTAIEGAHRVLEMAESLTLNPLDPSRSPVPDSPALHAQVAAELARCEGRHEPGLWRKAAENWLQLDRPFQTAYSRWRCAEAALGAKESEDAGEDLRSAYEIALRLEAKPLLNEIEHLARRGRIRLDESVATGDEAEVEQPPWERFGLTERELEVLKYLVEGLSNADIARKLFISPKTASVHVSNILRKLGAQGRVEAAGVAFRWGLLPDR